MNFTVFVGCDFAGKEPYRTLKGTVESFSEPGSKVYPILSNTDNKVLIEAFGAAHPDILNRTLLTRNLGMRIKTLIKNCDFAIFDFSDYKGFTLPLCDFPLMNTYCLNVIHEFGIAQALANDGKPTEGRYFYRKGLLPVKDVSNLQGELPLGRGPYKSFTHLKEQLEENLAPLIWLRRNAGKKPPTPP